MPYVGRHAYVGCSEREQMPRVCAMRCCLYVLCKRERRDTDADHQAIYRTAIRALSLSPFNDEALSSDVEMGNDEKHLLLFTLFMEHLQMPLKFQPHEVELQQSCAALFNCFKLLPFKYMPIAEVVVRDIFVLLEMASRPTATTDQPNSDKTIIDEALDRGAERAIADLPGAVSLKSKLLPFQIEIVYRAKPLAIRHLNSALIEKLVIIPGIVVQVHQAWTPHTRLLWAHTSAQTDFLQSTHTAAECSDDGTVFTQL